MARALVELWRLEVSEAKRRPRWAWLLFAAVVLGSGFYFVWVATHDAPSVEGATYVLCSGLCFCCLAYPRRWRPTASEPTDVLEIEGRRRMQGFALRLGFSLVVGLVAFVAVGAIALVLQPGSVWNAATRIVGGADILRRFEAAGYELRFPDELFEALYHNGDFSTAMVHGVWSPYLIAPLVGFGAYVVVVCSAVQPPRVGSDSAVFSVPRQIGLGGLSLLVLLRLGFGRSFADEIAYLHAPAALAVLLGVVALSGAVAVARWRRAGSTART